MRLRGVDMGLAVYEMEKERITESSYSNSRRGVEAWQLGVEFAAEGNTGRGM